MTAAAPTIGRAGERDVTIDVQRLVATRLLIQSNSGGGKSFAVRRLLEQTHGRAQHLVLDSEGEFFTLREKFDYVLAGRDRDCPVHPRAASKLARTLLDLGVSAILDLSDLKIDEKETFVARFCEGLLAKRDGAQHPTLVVIDEAHRFCPEGARAASSSADAVAELCSAGRKRALAAVLATQRLSKLSKDAVAECINRMIGRTGMDLDQRRAADEIGFASKADVAGLKSLEPGSFWTFGPAFGVSGVELVKVGPVATTHPEPGAKKPPVPAARGTVAAALAKLAEVPKEAEQEAKDLGEARARIRGLETELRQAKRGAPAIDPKAIEKACESIRAEARKTLRPPLRAITGCIDELERLANKMRDGSMAIRTGVGMCTAWLDRSEPGADGVWRPAAATNGATHAAPAAVNRVASPSRAPRADVADGLDRPKQRVLDALAWLDVAIPGASAFPREQVAAVAGYSPTSGGFGNLLGKLSTAGLISYPAPGFVCFTDDGRAAANHPSTPTTPEEIQRRVLDQVTAPQRRVLEAVLAKGRESQTRGEVAEASGYSPTSGGFGNLLGQLSTLGAIRYPLPGEVQAAPWLFLDEARA